MAYHEPTLCIATATLRSRMSSVRRDFSDMLKQYRTYQRAAASIAAAGGTPSREIVSMVAHTRSRLQSLSYRRRALVRAIHVLEEIEKESGPNGASA